MNPSNPSSFHKRPDESRRFKLLKKFRRKVRRVPEVLFGSCKRRNNSDLSDEDKGNDLKTKRSHGSDEKFTFVAVNMISEDVETVKITMPRNRMIDEVNDETTFPKEFNWRKKAMAQETDFESTHLAFGTNFSIERGEIADFDWKKENEFRHETQFLRHCNQDFYCINVENENKIHRLPPSVDSFDMIEPPKKPGLQDLTIHSESSSTAGAYSIEGSKASKTSWVNQDNFLLINHTSDTTRTDTLEITCDDSIDDNERSSWVVFDGHGEMGHLVSEFCRDRLKDIWIENDFCFFRTFKALNYELESSPLVDVRSSGSTCVMVTLHDGNCLQVAHCGDSRAVCGRWKGSLGERLISAVPLTSDHKPDRDDERLRIEEAGGIVGFRSSKSKRHVNRKTREGIKGRFSSATRVWYTHGAETMGLAMSRSLGDSYAKGYGVTEEPEVHSWTVDHNDAFIIAATDGIWDMIESEDAVQLVQRHLDQSTRTGGDWNVNDAAKELCHASRQCWSTSFSSVDDITAIVIDLRHVHEKGCKATIQGSGGCTPDIVYQEKDAACASSSSEHFPTRSLPSEEVQSHRVTRDIVTDIVSLATPCTDECVECQNEAVKHVLDVRANDNDGD